RRDMDGAMRPVPRHRGVAGPLSGSDCRPGARFGWGAVQIPGQLTGCGFGACRGSRVGRLILHRAAAGAGRPPGRRCRIVTPGTPQPIITVTSSAHIDFVGILFILWGLLTTLIGLSTLALGIGAVAIIASAARTGGAQVAAGVTAAAFTALALITIAWGA